MRKIFIVFPENKEELLIENLFCLEKPVKWLLNLLQKDLFSDLSCFVQDSIINFL